MSIKILMPALSPTMTEGNLTKWLVKEGDYVKAGDLLAEIETDKATMEIEAVDEGVIQKMLIQEGAESIKVNSPIAILADKKNEENKIDNELSLKNKTKKNVELEKISETEKMDTIHKENKNITTSNKDQNEQSKIMKNREEFLKRIDELKKNMKIKIKFQDLKIGPDGV